MPGLAPAGDLLFAARQKVGKKRALLCRPCGLPSLRCHRAAGFANSLRSNSETGNLRPATSPLGGAEGIRVLRNRQWLCAERPMRLPRSKGKASSPSPRGSRGMRAKLPLQLFRRAAQVKAARRASGNLCPGNHTALPIMNEPQASTQAPPLGEAGKRKSTSPASRGISSAS